jgi:hypothetical protein
MDSMDMFARQRAVSGNEAEKFALHNEAMHAERLVLHGKARHEAWFQACMMS